MARPVYILCSESGSEDKATSLISHFQVVDQIELREMPQLTTPGAPVVIAMIRLHATAVWEADPDVDIGRNFRFENCIYLPPDGRKIPANNGMFTFEKSRYRFTINVLGMVLSEPGSLVVESKICPEGSDDWLTQSYSISVVKVPAEDKAGESNTEGTGSP